MRGVVADLEGMAARGAVRADRLPALVETLERNSEWWASGPLLSSGARVGFAGSGLVWQHYPGHGIQIQWLGTLGKANGLFPADDQDAAFADLVGEAVSLAGNRAGGIGFEYLFPFDGGNPPWVVGPGPGHGADRAGPRGGSASRTRTWYDAARQAVGIFRVPPPEGVAQPTAAGTHYLQYSFAPKLHILNGFIQSLNGLFDYAKLLDDAEGRAAVRRRPRARRRAELPRYDTGGWSRYSEYTESSLHYHDVLRGFLATLCTRLQRPSRTTTRSASTPRAFTLDLTATRRSPSPPTRAGGAAKRRARVRFSHRQAGDGDAGDPRAVVRAPRGGVGGQRRRTRSAGRPPRAGRYADQHQRARLRRQRGDRHDVLARAPQALSGRP